MKWRRGNEGGRATENWGHLPVVLGADEETGEIGRDPVEVDAAATAAAATVVGIVSASIWFQSALFHLSALCNALLSFLLGCSVLSSRPSRKESLL